jgi:integrase
MSVRKRKWTTRLGEQREAWVVDYVDAEGKQRLRTFKRQRDAHKHHATIKVELAKGIHTAHGRTVAQAAKDWLAFVELEKRERSTLDQYRQHVNIHILPRIGTEKLSKLTAPRVNEFRDELLAAMSRAMAKKVLTSLKMLLRDAERRGNVAHNAAANVRISTDKRSKRKPKAGVDFPSTREVRSMIDAASGRIKPLLLVAVFTGLRSSELRGLRWSDVDLKNGIVHVTQRADRYNVIGRPKSESGNREIPLGPQVANALREWKLVCPRGPHNLVFPNGAGNFENHSNIVQRLLASVQIAAGLSVPTKERDSDGKPIMKPKYTGTHALRHFYASWCINRKVDGGLELPPKVVQERLGHSSIMMTMDVYGHLFPRRTDDGELAAAEDMLLG